MSDDFAEQVKKGIEALQKQSDEYWSDPYSKTCGLGFPHTVHPQVIVIGLEHYRICVNCGQGVRIASDDR